MRITGRSLYKAVYSKYVSDPLPSRSTEGRFHDSATMDVTTYLAATAETTREEVRYRWQADASTYRILEFDVKIAKIADMTDSALRKKYGIKKPDLVADDHSVCRQLASRLRSDGYEGIWSYSKADVPDGRVLVVFLDLLQKGSHVSQTGDHAF